jgi:hypothetical protein
MSFVGCVYPFVDAIPLVSQHSYLPTADPDHLSTSLLTSLHRVQLEPLAQQVRQRGGQRRNIPQHHVKREWEYIQVLQGRTRQAESMQELCTHVPLAAGPAT